MSEINLTSKNYDEEVVKSQIPVLIDFWATWCGPCRAMMPVVEQIANESEGKIKVCKVNVDNNQELAVKYNITNIPTLLFFKNGSLVNSSIGFVSKSELEEIINNFK